MGTFKLRIVLSVYLRRLYSLYAHGKFTQHRGWEPEAVLNWLALAGWGSSHSNQPDPERSSTPSEAPDSTAIYSVKELISEVRVSAMNVYPSSSGTLVRLERGDAPEFVS